ncbi:MULTISPECIES: DUF2771 domain-containing protein [unclassified Streptomyces]|jgi:hypothetical protein|uniref:DUF2771 domain-containing protein n=1 Tax=Streptomyces sp. NBC_01393 TaxID=2903851 RepID=A0AAU3I1D7_9ACTN|nr:MULTISPECIES: DUF2771 domain-containing protein [unclassified Streptomyces]
MTSLPRGRAANGQRAARRRRAVATVGAVSAGLLVLSACDKPTPMATVTVGDKSVSSEADCYNDGDALKATDLSGCLRSKDIKSITVDPDETVRFGVDPDIADKGWTLLMNGQQLLPETTKKTYLTIPGSVFFNQQYGATGSSTLVSIKEGKATATGLWSFKFKKDTDN